VKTTKTITTFRAQAADNKLNIGTGDIRTKIKTIVPITITTRDGKQASGRVRTQALGGPNAITVEISPTDLIAADYPNPGEERLRQCRRLLRADAVSIETLKKSPRKRDLLASRKRKHDSWHQ
jgi:hypothetical protein